MDEQKYNQNTQANVDKHNEEQVEKESYENQSIESNENGGKSNRGKKKTIWIVVIIILVIICILAGCYIYFIQKMNKINQTEIAPEDIANNTLSEEQTILLGDYTQIAVFGVDNRSNGNYGQGNSDTIMIASVNNKTKEVKIVSLYRDTYLRINNQGYYAKANAAYAYDGAVAALSMLNTNLDLDITQYVSVDWYAVVDAIDLLGGVDIEITEAERKKINEYAPEVEKVTGVQTSRLEESGLVHLDGVHAVAYMRIRKLAGDDYKRTQRQRIVIEATFNKVKEAQLSTLNKIVDQVFPMVETNLSAKDILSLAMSVGRYQIVSTTGFPFEKDTIVLSSTGDCVVPITLESNVKELHTYLFDKQDLEVSNEVEEISQEIINRTGLDEEHSEIDSDSYTTGESSNKSASENMSES